MVLGPAGRDSDSQTNIIIFGDTRTHQIIQERYRNINQKYYVRRV